MIELETCVLGEQGVQEPLWGPHVEDLRGGSFFAYLPHLGSASKEVQDPVAQGGIQTQGLGLVKSTMAMKAELLSMNSILT